MGVHPLAGLALLLLLGMMTSWQSSVGADGYTDQSLQGRWGFSASGTLVPPALPAATPAVAMGVMTFDGEGGCSITDEINLGGTSASRSSTSCAYGVAPDGIGFLSAQMPGDPGPTPLSFVIVDGKKELRFIRTDLGIASGVARRQ